MISIAAPTLQVTTGRTSTPALAAGGASDFALAIGLLLPADAASAPVEGKTPTLTVPAAPTKDVPSPMLAAGTATPIEIRLPNEGETGSDDGERQDLAGGGSDLPEDRDDSDPVPLDLPYAWFPPLEAAPSAPLAAQATTTIAAAAAPLSVSVLLRQAPAEGRAAEGVAVPPGLQAIEPASPAAPESPAPAIPAGPSTAPVATDGVALPAGFVPVAATEVLAQEIPVSAAPAAPTTVPVAQPASPAFAKSVQPGPPILPATAQAASSPRPRDPAAVPLVEFGSPVPAPAPAAPPAAVDAAVADATAPAETIPAVEAPQRADRTVATPTQQAPILPAAADAGDAGVVITPQGQAADTASPVETAPAAARPALRGADLAPGRPRLRPSAPALPPQSKSADMPAQDFRRAATGMESPPILANAPARPAVRQHAAERAPVFVAVDRPLAAPAPVAATSAPTPQPAIAATNPTPTPAPTPVSAPTPATPAPQGDAPVTPAAIPSAEPAQLRPAAPIFAAESGLQLKAAAQAALVQAPVVQPLASLAAPVAAQLVQAAAHLVEGFATPARPAALSDGEDAAIPSLTLAAHAGAATGGMTPPIAATTDSQAPMLDLHRQDWMGSMIDHIETLRDAMGGPRETRIRLSPDALGSVDVSIRQDGDRVHVHFAAESQAARQHLQDAAPRLAEIAEGRGLKMAQATVDGGSAGMGTGGQRREAQAEPRVQQNSGVVVSGGASDAETDARVA
jgi:flagellar hook-length control protein FliK